MMGLGVGPNAFNICLCHCPFVYPSSPLCPPLSIPLCRSCLPSPLYRQSLTRSPHPPVSLYMPHLRYRQTGQTKRGGEKQEQQ